MKKAILCLALMIVFLRPLGVAQSTIYFSNLGEPSAGSKAIGNDAWLTQSFRTGTNAGGYFLNSIQLPMSPASGNPAGFSIAIYSHTPGDIRFPGSFLASLSGGDPAAGGIFSYDGSGFFLSPATSYFVVLTASTPVTSGAYSWNVTSSFNADSVDGWGGIGFHFSSTDGVVWSRIAGPYFQFGVNATAVPEPTTPAIIVLGLVGLSFLRCRK